MKVTVTINVFHPLSVHVFQVQSVCSSFKHFYSKTCIDLNLKYFLKDFKWNLNTVIFWFELNLRFKCWFNTFWRQGVNNPLKLATILKLHLNFDHTCIWISLYHNMFIFRLYFSTKQLSNSLRNTDTVDNDLTLT